MHEPPSAIRADVAVDGAPAAAGRASGARPLARWRAELGFAGAALGGALLAWGFGVDDALISGRVAHHLATGLGYRYNPHGPSVDCVTPFGWSLLLAPFALESAWGAITAASLAGAALWVLTAGWLGRRCATRCAGWRLAAVGGLLAACLPLGAWAVAGMETAFVMALGVLALASDRWGAAAAGLAAAWRPELAPWALALSFGQALARRASPGEKAIAVALALGPALAVALGRRALFGHAAPLAVFAKPSDMEHGVRYALGSLLLSGPPYLLLAGRSWRALPRPERAIAAALGVHWLVLAGVGGDWMPFWRLAMPVMPGVLLVGAALLGATSSRLWAARFVPALAAVALLHTAQGQAARRVRAERASLIAELPPLLAGVERVASLDVGWVGAAGDYDVVDLAGLTDPEVAYLPGGHTSKRLPEDFLERRRVQALVLLTESTDKSFARQVERRVMTLRGAERFAPVARLPLGERRAYVVLRRALEDPG